MNTVGDIKVLFDQTCRDLGYGRSGHGWATPPAEVTWLITLERSGRSPRYGLEAGAVFGDEVMPTAPNSCSLRLFAEFLPLPALTEPTRLRDSFRDEVIQAFDLEAPAEAERRDLIVRITVAVAGYLAGLSNDRAVRDEYRAGRLRAAVILRERRSWLDAGAD